MDHKCCSRVWPARAMRSSPCRNNAKVEREGRHYCGKHDPVAVAAKNAEKNKKQKEKWAARDALWAEADAKRKEIERRAECFPGLLAACQEIFSWFDCAAPDCWPSAMDTVRDAISKATGK